MNEEVDQRLRDIQRDYLDFLDDDEDQGIYQQKVRDMISNNEIRLVVNINDLRKKNPKRTQSLLGEGFEEMVAFQRALKDFVGSADPLYSKQHEEFFVGFEGRLPNLSKTTSRYVCVQNADVQQGKIRHRNVLDVLMKVAHLTFV